MREIEQLSVQQLCGQLLVVGFAGTEVPEHVTLDLRNRALGGVILFSRNFNDWRGAWSMCVHIADACAGQLPPFVCIDQEGGRVQRIKDKVLNLPPLAKWAHRFDDAMRRKVAQQQATELAAIGFNVNFAPVADVNSNEANPVIGDRAASADPALVTRICRMLIQGQQAAGVVACVKHFPGHGDTEVDSHVELPTVNKSTFALRTTELYPFERLSRDAAAVMTAHVVFPSLDSVPATFSPRLCTTLLRREFGFEGVLFSDDLEMGALEKHWPVEESAVRAVRAGCDTLLVCSSEHHKIRALRALTAEVEKDPKFKQRVIEAVERSLQTRRRYPARPAVNEAAVLAVLESHAHRDLQRKLNVVNH
jgi:beta-N-acetylhexosaminidase